MFELVINEKSYQFKFGIGFVKAISKTAQRPVDGVPGSKEDVGLSLSIARILDGDVIELAKVLEMANKGFEPRITSDVIEGYIEDECTDIDKLFEDVLGFFEQSNSTRKVAKKMIAAYAEQEEQKTNQ